MNHQTPTMIVERSAEPASLALPADSVDPQPPAAHAWNSVDASLEEFDRVFQGAREEELDLIAVEGLASLVRLDPLKTARFIELQPPSARQRILVRHFSRLWGERDPERAFAWAQNLPDAQDSSVARRSVCLSLGSEGLAAAVERCVETLREDEAGLQSFFQTWAQSDPGSARNWLDSQPASAKADTFRRRISYVLATVDAPQAMRLAQDGFSSSMNRHEALIAVLHQWALRDPEAARAWAETLAPEEIKPRALSEIDGLESYTTGGH